MVCDCKCHQENAVNNLKRCEEQNKRNKKELDAMKKKIIALTVAIAVIGTIVGKEGLDRVVEYFETIDKVKQSATRLIETSRASDEILPPIFGGVSPSPSTLSVFVLAAMLPTRRRT